MLRIVPATEKELKEGKPLSAIPVAVSHKQVKTGWKRAGHPHFFIRHLACGLEKGSRGDSAGASFLPQLPPSLTRPSGWGEGAAGQQWPFPPPSLRLHRPSASFPWALPLLLTFTKHDPLDNSVPWTGQQTRAPGDPRTSGIGTGNPVS